MLPVAKEGELYMNLTAIPSSGLSEYRCLPGPTPKPNPEGRHGGFRGSVARKLGSESWVKQEPQQRRIRSSIPR